MKNRTKQVTERIIGTTLDDERYLELMDFVTQGWKLQVELLQAELDKFHECDESSGCHDRSGRLHIHDSSDMSFVYITTGETIRAVWHKEGA
jgi:hypothetical protein